MKISIIGDLITHLYIKNSPTEYAAKTLIFGSILLIGAFFLLGAQTTARAATFTVTKTADTNDGACDSDCSLREAIGAANAAATDDVIEFDSTVFSSAQIIKLGGENLEISANGKLNINGKGPALLTISGNNLNRIFIVSRGATATINEITLTEGNGLNKGSGGAIVNLGTVLLNNSIVRNNFGDAGGGIYNEGSLSIITSTITGNNGNLYGGGIYNFNSRAVLTISDSTISNNTARREGGGIFNNGTVSITNSTVSGNSATDGNVGSGGGIFTTGSVNSGSLLNIVNSTIAENISRTGGGISNAQSTVSLNSSTIVNNVIDDRAGGGVANSGGTVTAHNTLIANNVNNPNPTGHSPDFGGTLTSRGYNLIGNINGLNVVGDATGNILGVDPRISPLGNYGGTTQTISLNANSPAIDSANPNDFPAADQRGVNRPQDGTGDGSARADIGAFELRVIPVSNINDNGEGSLRQAIIEAGSQADTIIFSTGIFNSAQTITLTTGELKITANSNFTIDGNSADRLTISGNNQSRVIFVNENANLMLKNITIAEGNGTGQFSGVGGGMFISNNARVVLENAVVKNNSATLANASGTLLAGGGGGIYNSGNLVVNQSKLINNKVTISGSSAAGGGGGLYNFRSAQIIKSSISNNSVERIDDGFSSTGGGISNSRNLDIIDSTISYNTAQGNGGGIISGFEGIVNITNSTISNNSATTNAGAGGGFTSSSEVNIINSTVANNSAENAGGGITVIPNSTKKFKSKNSIYANNKAVVVGPDFWGKITSQGYNLIENTQGTIIEGESKGNIIGFDPQLLPLGDYGGATQTHALRPNSPAIDSADPTSFPETDQRGVKRPQDGDLNNSKLPDIGAYERQVATVKVTKDNDTNDGVCNADCSLREAIQEISKSTEVDKAITFDAVLFSTNRTITLRLGELILDNFNGSLTIKGTGADILSISGNNQSRVFSITGSNVTLDGVTIKNGNSMGTTSSGRGGGVYNSSRSDLTIINSVLSSNTASSLGGGIFNAGVSTLKLFDSTVKNNSANEQGGGIMNVNGMTTVISSTIDSNSITGSDTFSGGGGIYNANGSFVMENSTVSNNKVKNSGGGINNNGQGILNLTNSTISSNSTTGSGGGISNFSTVNLTNTTITQNSAEVAGGVSNIGGGDVNSRNSIIADNAASSLNASPDFDGRLNSQGYNLIKNTQGITIIGDLTGNILNVDPQLLSLGNYGGATKTHALRPNSPAIDKGKSFGSKTDQRRFTRPYDFPNIPNASGGDGSDIGAVERQANELGRSVRFDFDGDGKTDISVFRPSLGQYFYLRSSDGVDRGFQFGLSSDIPAPADFTGDGKTDIAFFRPSSGTWFVLRSEDQSFYAFPFGANGDIPATGDFDGDGRSDAAVFRPSSGTWFILNSSDGSVTTRAFGLSGDVPIVRDYDGDGRDDLAVYRPSQSEWYLNRSTAGFIGFRFGAVGDTTPTPADFTGDGKADIAFFAPSNGQWFVLRSEDISFYAFPFGIAGDIPAAGDYDGDGRADAAVFRPSSGVWYINQSSSGQSIVQFGANGDQPIPSVYIP